MPQKGSPLKVEAHQRGMVPSAPIARVVGRWIDKQQTALWGLVTSTSTLDDNIVLPPRVALAHLSGVSVHTIENLFKPKSKKKLLSFDLADKLVCATVGDWRADPELEEIYESFDFTYLDLRECPTENADGLLTLLEQNVPQAEIARRFGVSKQAVTTAIRKRTAAVAA